MKLHWIISCVVCFCIFNVFADGFSTKDDFNVDMAFVPEGTFTAGFTKANDEAFIRECLKSGYKKRSTCENNLSEFKSGMPRPTSTSVFVSSFYIDIREVSVDDYLKCMDAGACHSPQTEGSTCPLLSTHMMYQKDLIYGDHPINCVTHDDAQDYCRWQSKRLPSIDEWEKASRGSSDDRFFPWGNSALSCNRVGSIRVDDECLWFPGGSFETCMALDSRHPCRNATRMLETTWPVDSKPQGASPYGVLHMADNVKEWVSDETLVDGEVYYFIRGGDHSEPRPHLNVFGSFFKPLHRVVDSGILGFRCAKSVD